MRPAGPGAAIFVREAAPQETRALAGLHLDVALEAYAGIFPPDAPEPTLDDLASRWELALAVPSAKGFVAVLATVPVGVAMGGPDADDPARGHLSRLYVRPAQWGCGAGRLLHDAALDHLRQAGFSEATLWVLERNQRARSWYERLGWQRTGGRKPVYAPASIDDIAYTRTL